MTARPSSGADACKAAGSSSASTASSSPISAPASGGTRKPRPITRLEGAVGEQPEHGLAQRRAADAEVGRQVDLVDPGARRQAAVDHPGEDLGAHVRAQRLALKHAGGFQTATTEFSAPANPLGT